MNADMKPVGIGLAVAGVAIALAIVIYSESQRYHGLVCKFGGTDVVVIVDGKTGKQKTTLVIPE